jgi:GDSL-like Lipase/Acylhydrolase
MESSMTCSVILVGAIATCVMSASAQDPPPIDHIVVFGDSLSDTGNAGRFSNGPVWVEQLAARLEIALRPTQAGGLNFAVGGARLDPLSGPHSLRAQADLFLRMRQPSGRTLHIVYGGGNDLCCFVEEYCCRPRRARRIRLAGAKPSRCGHDPENTSSRQRGCRARRLAHAAVQQCCRPCPL